MKDFISIIINKFITLIFKILKPIIKKDGSVTPGYYASLFNKNVLNNLKYPKLVIGVTGSSGKGSTTSLIAHILKNNGYNVVWNEHGSNLYNAAVTLILNNTNPFTKKINADILLLELDESYISQIFKKQKLTHLVITNITRDQPSRNGHTDLIYNKIKNSIDRNTHLIINADDPIVSKIKLNHKGKVTTYGVSKTKYDIETPNLSVIEAAYCPVCNTKLNYNYYHYGHIGSYYCPKCNFSKGKLDYEATDINIENGSMLINNINIRLNKKVFFAVYYTLAAYSLCSTIGLDSKKITKQLNNNVMQSKRMNIYKFKDRDIEMIESKNENSLSYLQTINYITNDTPLNKTIIMGFDNVSRRYDLNDISWLYDIEFEKMNTKEIDKIFCIGRFRYDVYLRLKYAGFDTDKLIIVDDIDNILKLVDLKSLGKIYTMVCFDMTERIKKILGDEEYEKNKNSSLILRFNEFIWRSR